MPPRRQPGYRSMAGRPTWSELHASDLYTWFNLSESGRSASGPGLTRAQLRPGGFEQFIDFSVVLDSQEVVVGASLALDRNWLDGDRVGLANGGDLAKSLLNWLGSADRALPEVASQLEATVMSSAGAIVRGPRKDVTVDGQVAPLLEAFLGAAPVADGGEVFFLGQRLLRAANIEYPNGQWFQLAWGDSARNPGEVPKWQCDVCGVPCVERQVGEDPISGATLHWVWVPGGRVGHPVSCVA